MNEEGRKLVLIGGGGHALVVAETALTAGWNIGGFLDDRPDANLAGHATRLGKLMSSGDLGDGTVLHLALGNLAMRHRLLGDIRGWFATIVHPTTTVSRTASVGPGVFISAGAIIQGRTTIGPHAIINTGAIIEHDCIVGENSHIAPRATLLGEVRVGAHTLIGAGAVILPGMHVGSHAVVGAGAVVTRDVPDGSTVVGVPAKRAGLDL